MSISIGIDPAIYLATSFMPPTTLQGCDELSIAGGLRGQAVELSRCVSIDEYAIANAEVVIEGVILPGSVRRRIRTPTGLRHAGVSRISRSRQPVLLRV